MPEQTNPVDTTNVNNGGGNQTVNNQSANADVNQTPNTQTPNTGAENTPTFTQADLDRAVAKALSKRESNLKADFERKQLEEKGKYEELYRKSLQDNEALAQSITRSTFISKNGDIAAFLPVLEQYPVDKLEEMGATIRNTINAQVEAELKKRLNTNSPVSQTVNQSGPLNVKDMTPDQFKEWKKSQGYTV